MFHIANPLINISTYLKRLDSIWPSITPQLYTLIKNSPQIKLVAVFMKFLVVIAIENTMERKVES